MNFVKQRLKFIVPVFLRRWLRARIRELREAKDYFKIRRKYGDFSLSADLAAAVRCWLRLGKTILFYPQRPKSAAAAYKLMALLGYSFTNNPSHQFDVVFRYKNTTLSDASDLDRVPVDRDKIINAQGLDIRKRTVSQTFEEVFGYPLEVDPTQYEGQIVEKSNLNAAHDGRVLVGPIPPQAVKADAVYQKAIDNRSDKPGMILDYRVPIHGDQIPLVYLKHRPIEIRFLGKNAEVNIAEKDDVFSPAEQDNLLRLAKAMGMDFAEFDVLRDRDGRIYVVDINNTPWSPPNQLEVALAGIALRRLSQTFDRLLASKM